MTDAGIITRTVTNAVFVSVLAASLIGSVILGFVGVRWVFPPMYELGPIASGAVLLAAFMPLALTAGFWLAVTGGHDE